MMRRRENGHGPKYLSAPRADFPARAGGLCELLDRIFICRSNICLKSAAPPTDTLPEIIDIVRSFCSKYRQVLPAYFVLGVAGVLWLSTCFAALAAPKKVKAPPKKTQVAPIAAKQIETPEDIPQQVIDLTNKERATKGLPPLVPDPLLMRAAQTQAQDMLSNNYFSHRDRNGGQPWDRTQALGYASERVGENIAFGQDVPTEVMETWMASEGHRANILNRDYRAIGVGVAGTYWVQVFGDKATHGAVAAAEVVIADFEEPDYTGWELSGNCWGKGPESLTFAGNVLSGWSGYSFATTAHRRAVGLDPASGTGTAVSAPFTIPADALRLRFLIAGGRYPEHCCLNLLVDGKVVHTATGASIYHLEQTEWDITDLRGKTVRLEIRDDVAQGANAFIHVDDIILIRDLPHTTATTPKKTTRSPRT
jgi:uncharacterized protein YkwD